MPPKAKAAGRSKSKGGKKPPPLEIKSRIQDPDRELYMLICNRASTEVIRQLVMIHRPDVNMKYSIDRFTPLLRAAQRGESRLVEVLLDLKADPNYKDVPQMPGTVAADDGKGKGSAKAAAKKAPAKEKSDKKKPAGKGDAEIGKDRCPPVPMEPIADGGTALHIAVLTGNLRVVSALLNCNTIDPNVLDKKGRTPLMLACSEGRERTTQRLLNNPSVNVEKRDLLGRTILMVAGLRGHVNICKLILACKQTSHLIDEKDPRGRTALDIVLAHCCSPEGPAIIDLLRAAKPGMSVNNEDLTKYVVREGAVRLLPGGRVVKEVAEAVDENGEIELFRTTRLILSNESARGSRQMEVAEAMLREMPISALTRKNNSNQTLLHVSCGALPVKRKIVEAHHDEYKRQGNVGTDRSGLEELKAMIHIEDDEAGGDEALEEGLVLTKIDGDRCKAESISILALAENRARRRLHRRLVAAIINAAPEAMREEKDARKMTALNYAQVFGDEEIIRMLRASPPVRPRSPSAKDDLSIFHQLPAFANSGSTELQEGDKPPSQPTSPTGRRLSSPGTRQGLARPTSAMSVNSLTSQMSSAQMSDQPREGEAREGWGETSTAPSTRPQTPVRYSRKGGAADPEKESKAP